MVLRDGRAAVPRRWTGGDHVGMSDIDARDSTGADGKWQVQVTFDVGAA